MQSPKLNFCSSENFDTSEKTMPRLFLGDRSFLRRYDSQLSSADITKMMLLGFNSGGLGLSYSDTRTAHIVRNISRSHEPIKMLHAQDLISSPNTVLSSKLLGELKRFAFNKLNTNFLQNDVIVGSFCRQIPNFLHSMSDNEILHLKACPASLKLAGALIEIGEPDIVTIGGDWLDVCLILGREDLILECLSALKSYTIKGTTFLMLTYFGPCLPSQTIRILSNFDGIFLPINLLGDGMPPGRDENISWLIENDIKTAALHTLALGRVPPLPALDYVLNHLNIPIAVVGCSSDAQLNQLLLASKTILREDI